MRDETTITSKDPKWKLFEKLVAAIHRAEQQGAEVKWNEKIDRRQFDVTVRFKAGVHTYLTVIECRDQGSPLKVERIDAFVTKARDAKANKAIMVSASGFQEGCFGVAERHGIDLFTMQELRDLPAELLEEGLIPTLNFYSFVLSCGKDGSEKIELPEERNILPFLIKDALIERGTNRITLESMIDFIYSEVLKISDPEPKDYRINLLDSSTVTLPDIKSGNTLETITLEIRAIDFKHRVTPARYLGGPGLDPYLLRNRYAFRNVVTGETHIYGSRDLVVGFETVFKPGTFYVDIHSEFRYFCHKVEGDLITLTMLEGYQHGKHLQATFKFLESTGHSYIELVDGIEIARLKAMLRTLRERSGLNAGAEEVLDT
ncbi:MAG: restriction endonuclease [Thermoanaerobaculia bacterium]